MENLNNSKTSEMEKIFCPKNGVVMIEYDKRHKPKVKLFIGV